MNLQIVTSANPTFTGKQNDLYFGRKESSMKMVDILIMSNGFACEIEASLIRKSYLNNKQTSGR